MDTHQLKTALEAAPIVPVLTIPDGTDAAALAKTFVDAGLKAVEVTLRTVSALQAITDMKAAAPALIVGSGTVIDSATLQAASSAGADFHVSPGMTPALHEAAKASGELLIPGVATPSEAMTRSAEGYEFLKLFPASIVGGVGMLKAMSGPLPHLSFMPTGGVNSQNLADYMGLPNVVAVGGTWLAPVDDLKDSNWDAIGERTRQALSAAQ